jgi:hypothetical protein
MKYFPILSLAIFLFSCQDGDDASLFNNTNETVFAVNIPMSYNFDRLTTPVAVQFYDNAQFKGNAVKSVNIYMVEKDDKEHDFTGDNQKPYIRAQENPSAEYNSTHLNLLKEGNYYVFCFIDLNKNGTREQNEPIEYFASKEDPKKIRVLKESRRTITFDFDL